ncbi:MAG: FeoB-associated Cys-rich membrane protein [Solidesulfovibrio sp.]|uniref:FeoB-associated Cys-rich membrane protein n=1 Tax=Solidesulfovibrio sp. TaxID=2910990 RepID=UPI002B1FB146|nr:FeoB-associated Cys-rich membrane protein [Solidesulfovibrio sp.]MEA4857972.1 FeoB-associated Cys-rich membrane protein [Solidesulfovibrio sp.]
MDKVIVFLIIALAAGYVIRRFFFKKSSGCGCGCNGGCQSPEKKDTCCDNGQRLQ